MSAEDQPIIGHQTTAQNEAVETVLGRIDADEIFIPSYQRDSDEWNATKKSLFVESILNRLTVPAFYLAASESGPERFEVIDGQQRLTYVLCSTSSGLKALTRGRGSNSLSLSAISMSAYGGISTPLLFITDRKSTRLNSSHTDISRMPSSA